MRGQGRSCRLAAALGLPLLMLLSELPPASGTVPPLRLRGGSNRPFFMGKVRGGVAQRTSGLRPLFGGIQPSSSPKDLSSRSYPRGAAAAETASVPSSGRFRFRRMIQGRKFERMSDIFDRVAPPRNSGCQAVARPHREEQAGKRQQSELSPVVGDEDHHGWWDGGDLSEQNREEWLTNLRDRFDAADLDGDGGLNVSELRNVLECTDQFCLSRHWLPLEQAAEVLQKYDTEHTGVLDFSHFVDMADDHNLLMGFLDDYLEAFQALDTDGSGRIERKEMRTLLDTVVGESETQDQKIDALFRKADLNGDDSTICFSEFLELIRSHTVDLQLILDYMKLKPEPAKATTATEEGKPAAAAATASSSVGQAPSQEKAASENSESNDDLSVAPTLVPGTVVTVHSAEQFEAIVNENPIVVLEVTFKWCRPCKMFAKKYSDIARDFPGVVMLKVVGDESQTTKAMLQTLGIKLSPTFVLYKNQMRAKTVSGANDHKVRSMILNHLADSSR